MATDWAGQAEAYDRSFARLCAGSFDALISELEGLDMDASVLDAGCGTGQLVNHLQKLGLRAQGIDADREMVAFAQMAFPEASFAVDELPNLGFADAIFDATIANFVVNHALKPLDFTRDLARVTKPRGRVVATIWPSSPVSALNQLWADVIADSGATPLTGHRLPAEDDFERSVTRLAELFDRAGLVDTRSAEVNWEFSIDPNDLWAAVEAGIANIGATYWQQSAATQQRMRDVFDEFTAGERVALPTVAVIGAGNVPAGRT